MKRYLVPVVAGVTVFGAATAFAASLTVTSDSLSAGNATVAHCNASATANIDYSTTNMTYQAGNTPIGYEVGDVPIQTAATCAGKSFKVTLIDSANAALGEEVGTLSSAVGFEGTATATFAGDNVPAASVTGVHIVVYG